MCVKLFFVKITGVTEHFRLCFAAAGCGAGVGPRGGEAGGGAWGPAGFH